MKRRAGLLLCLLLLCGVRTASAQHAVLPAGTETVEEEAFRGCASLDEVTIPASVLTIGENAFAECGEALWVHCEPGSEAARYARAEGLDYDADTSFRALLIGQTYPLGGRPALEGPETDVGAMSRCLRGLDRTPYTVTVRKNLSADEMVAWISSAFSGATENDVSLFYYSGHGETDGSLVGADPDGSLLSPRQLKNALDAVPGRKVVVVDCCYSGKLIDGEAEEGEPVELPLSAAAAAEEETAASPADFVSAFQAAFRPRLRGVLNVGQYYVIASAQAWEKSEEVILSGSRKGGLFTCGLCEACGWDEIGECALGGLPGDENGDGAVSVAEAFEWADGYAYSRNPNQSAAVWPEGCRAFAPFRE